MRSFSLPTHRILTANMRVLMTALTQVLALLPIALGGDLPGYEIEYPMALVILGGMVSSTILSLFLLPAFYLMLGFAPATVPEAPGVASKNF